MEGVGLMDLEAKVRYQEWARDGQPDVDDGDAEADWPVE